MSATTNFTSGCSILIALVTSFVTASAVAEEGKDTVARTSSVESGSSTGMAVGYGEIQAMSTLGTYGKAIAPDINLWEEEYAIKGKVMSGARLAGYGVIRKFLHLGGYIHVRGGMMEYGIGDELYYNSRTIAGGGGAALKAGALAGSRNKVWLGVGLDLGFHYMLLERYEEEHGNGTVLGLEVVPRLAVDVLLIQKPHIKVSVPIGLFAHIVSYSREDLEPGVSTKQWHISPAIAAGIAIGR